MGTKPRRRPESNRALEHVFGANVHISLKLVDAGSVGSVRPGAGLSRFIEVRTRARRDWARRIIEHFVLPGYAVSIFYG